MTKTTIATITEEQILNLKAEAAGAGDEGIQDACTAALDPQPGDYVIWDVGPEEDHDEGEILEDQQIRGGIETRIKWEGSNETTTQWYEVAPTEAAHECVEAINEREEA